MRRLVAAMFVVCGAGACGGLVAPIATRDGEPEPHGSGSGSGEARKDSGTATSSSGADSGTAQRDAGVDAKSGDSGADAGGGRAYTNGGVLYRATDITAFTLGPSDVFVVDYLKHQIVRVPKNGAPPVVLATRPPSTIIMDIAIDGTNVYWSYGSGLGLASDAIETVPIAGGDVTTLAQGDFYSSMAVDATGLYWTTETAVMKADLDGSNARVIVPAQSRATQISVKGSLLCWATSSGGFPRKLSCSGLEGENVTDVWTDGEWVTGSAIETNELLALEQYGVMSGPNPYFLHVAPLPATLASASGAPGGGRARRIAFDDASFFIGWPNGVARFPRGGSSIDVTPPNVPSSTYGLDVALDDTNVYWIEYEGGIDNTLRTLPK